MELFCISNGYIIIVVKAKKEVTACYKEVRIDEDGFMARGVVTMD